MGSAAIWGSERADRRGPAGTRAPATTRRANKRKRSVHVIRKISTDILGESDPVALSCDTVILRLARNHVLAGSVFKKVNMRNPGPLRS